MTIAEIAGRRSQFATRKVNEELVLVPLKGSVAEMEEMFTLNELGSFIWEQLHGQTTEETLVDAIVSEFDIDRETAATDLSAFLEDLSAAIDR